MVFKINNNNPQRGFTLIEILVSIGVLSIISGLAISIFVSLNASYDKASVINSVTYEGNRVMELITRSIHSASNAEYVSATHVRLTIPQESSNLEFANNGECTQVDIVYNAANSNIEKSSPSSACQLTAVCPSASPCVINSDDVDVSAMDFAVTSNYDTPDVVSINITIQQDASLSDPEQQSSQLFEKVILTRGY